MQTIRNDEERSIWDDACQLRRKYAHADLRGNAHQMCSLIVDTIRLKANHKDHPMAAFLAETMADDIRSRWAAANQFGSGG